MAAWFSAINATSFSLEAFWILVCFSFVFNFKEFLNFSITSFLSFFLGESFSVLWLEDYLWRLHCYSGQKQSPRFDSQYSLCALMLNRKLSRPKYLRARLLKGDEIFVFQKETQNFLIPVLSKNLVKLYREVSNAPTPIYCWKKNVKNAWKGKSKEMISHIHKKSFFLTRKITVRCSIKKEKKIICDVLLS